MLLRASPPPDHDVLLFAYSYMPRALIMLAAGGLALLQQASARQDDAVWLMSKFTCLGHFVCKLCFKKAINYASGAWIPFENQQSAKTSPWRSLCMKLARGAWVARGFLQQSAPVPRQRRASIETKESRHERNLTM
ncbi:hypothetical protein [uncultured Aquitalea sp.]|uniref:hypothetical protein n=1 Tax=uncultured Aquitalea sp. TaxID=540272 RepID=UPI0025D81732|nr:hypothetical protein [uncultured Aquitalea sp.]